MTLLGFSLYNPLLIVSLDSIFRIFNISTFRSNVEQRNYVSDPAAYASKNKGKSKCGK